jgi:hypothetical protein
MSVPVAGLAPLDYEVKLVESGGNLCRFDNHGLLSKQRRIVDASEDALVERVLDP